MRLASCASSLSNSRAASEDSSTFQALTLQYIVEKDGALFALVDPVQGTLARQIGLRPRTDVVSALHHHFPGANDICTSVLSASSTFSMGRGVRRMKAATKVSGTCWMRMLKVLTESL